MTHKVSFNSREFRCTPETVLVKPKELPKGKKTTDSGMIVALQQNESVVDRSTEGTVIDSGSPDFKKNDYVVWVQTAGEDVEFTDGVFLILKAQMIIGSKK